MTRTIPENAREHADLALAVYVEELAARRRVLFVGDAASAVPERLSSVARSVEVVSPRTRARGTRRGGRILPRPWPSPQDARSWDLVLVPDLLWAGPPAPERIAEMSEWLTARGVLVVGAEEREDGIGYAALYELLAGTFEQVRMLGQAPFAGWAVVDFSPQKKELDVTFDGSLLGGTGEEPARFLAICASREVVLDPYAIIQVPSGTRGEVRPAPERPREDVQLQARVAQMEVQLHDRQEELDRSNEHSEGLEKELTAARARIEHAERRLDQAQREIARGAGKLDEARARAEAVATELETARGEMEALRSAPASTAIDEEYARVETALAERGRELTELRVEIDRRGTLVRDLIEELREARARGTQLSPSMPGAGSAPSRAPLDGSASAADGGADAEAFRHAMDVARRRAVDAEAAVAEAGFRLDEVRGELAICRRQRETEREATAHAEAERTGTVRGLFARLAETDEMRRLCEARLALAQDDVVSARGRIRELERDLGVAHEHAELAGIRAHGRPRGDAALDTPSAELTRALEQRLATLEAEAAEREGRLRGALLQTRERLADLDAERARLEGELARAEAGSKDARAGDAGERGALEARLGQLAEEATRALEDSERHSRELVSLRARCDDESRELASVRGEREGLRLRLADAEAAFEASRARATQSPAESPELPELRQRIEVLGASLAMWTQRAQEATARAEAEAKRAADLGVRISTRDALIGRIQSEAAEAAARRDGLERRARDLDASSAQLRESLDQSRAIADVRADEDRRESHRLEERVGEVDRARERAEREHEETRRALGEARQILSAMATGLDVGVGVGVPAPASDPRMREQMQALQREAEDRELMLRSLTAQLQDRDDRLRAVERLREQGIAGDAQELAHRVLHAEERAVRLERELDQERTARRSAESSSGGAERDAELRRLNQLLGDRDAHLMVLEGRITSGEREQRVMRDAFAQARGGLETLLGEIANDQRAEAADRIASMLRLLRRY